MSQNPTTILYSATPTISTSAYSSGDTVGGLITLTDVMRTAGGCGVLESLCINDVSNQKSVFDILIYDSLPTVAADNAALVISAADAVKIVARIPVAAADYATNASRATANLRGLGALVRSTTKTLYVAIVTTSTPTYALLALNLRFGFLRD